MYTNPRPILDSVFIFIHFKNNNEEPDFFVYVINIFFVYVRISPGGRVVKASDLRSDSRM